MLKQKSKSMGLSRFRDPVVSRNREPARATMGERIKALREDRGLNQGELGALLGVSAQAVCQWETGVTINIKPDPFARMLDLFEVDYRYLIWGRNSVPPLKTA